MLSHLDLFRSKILKESFRLPALRFLFHNRAHRILALFAAASMFYFILSSFFPLWVLLAGPILWGIPHLISSIRYTSFSFEENRRNILYGFQFAIWAVVFAYRLGVDVFAQQLYLSQYPLMFESICLLISFIFQLLLSPNFSFKLILSTLIFAILLAATYSFPIQTALFLLIGHNYIPLYAWYQSCGNSADRKTFYLSTALYAVLSFFILNGTFEFLYASFVPSGRIDFLNWDYSEIIAPFAENENAYPSWYKIVVLYAFSQAIHYFIWLKAIPENYQSQQYPPSFKWSFNKLSTDFGQSSILLLFIITLVGTSIWLFFEFQTARLVYFAIASYHGFMEISAIPFLKPNQKD